MYLWLVFDLIILAIFVLSIRHCIKHGLINASKTILSIVLTILIMTSSHAYISSWLKTSVIGDRVTEGISNILKDKYSQSMPSESKNETLTGLPSFIEDIFSSKTQELENAQKDFTNALTDQITDSVISVIAIIFLYLAVRVFLWIFLKILNLIFELPILKSVNKLSGAFIGVINALFLTYLFCAILVLFIPSNASKTVADAVSNTYLTKYFYENNLLLKLFM